MNKYVIIVFDSPFGFWYIFGEVSEVESFVGVFFALYLHCLKSLYVMLIAASKCGGAGAVLKIGTEKSVLHLFHPGLFLKNASISFFVGIGRIHVCICIYVSSM